MSLTVDTADLRAHLAALQARITTAGTKAETTFIDDRVADAKALVPVATGALRDSIHADGSEIIADRPYAAAVHEDLGAHHPHGGQAKYIETPMVEEADALPQHFVRALEGNP